MSHPAYQKATFIDSSIPRQKYENYIQLGALNYTVNEGFATAAIHAGQKADSIHGSLNIPIHMSTTYQQKTPTEYLTDYSCSKRGNPTTDALNQCISTLEHASHTWTFATGRISISAILSLLKAGDHMLVCDFVYGGSNRLVEHFSGPQSGFNFDYVDMADLEKVEAAIKPNTKLIWLESPTNPNMKVMDIAAICEISNKHNIISIVDNSFASPFLQNPILLGATIAFSSLSK